MTLNVPFFSQQEGLNWCSILENTHFPLSHGQMYDTNPGLFHAGSMEVMLKCVRPSNEHEAKCRHGTEKNQAHVNSFPSNLKVVPMTKSDLNLFVFMNKKVHELPNQNYIKQLCLETLNLTRRKLQGKHTKQATTLERCSSACFFLCRMKNHIVHVVNKLLLTFADNRNKSTAVIIPLTEEMKEKVGSSYESWTAIAWLHAPIALCLVPSCIYPYLFPSDTYPQTHFHSRR